MVLDIALRTEGIPEKPRLEQLSPVGHRALDDIASQLECGTPEQQASAYTSLSFFMGLYPGRFELPHYDQYMAAMCLYERRQ